MIKGLKAFSLNLIACREVSSTLPFTNISELFNGSHVTTLLEIGNMYCLTTLCTSV
jgi:hypothetical protein